MQSIAKGLSHFMKLKYLLALSFCVACLVVPTAFADPAKAEDDAYHMAVHYTATGFYMSPTNTSGIAGTGFTVKVLIPVSKGLDYVILIGRDTFARDIDLYVYDEVGQLILDDRRPSSRAGVKFRSSYSGTVQAIVHIAHAHGLCSYAVLVGRRGIERSSSTVESMGVEPTFEMDGGKSPSSSASPSSPPSNSPKP
jgi:hypothetical protein